jgi:hypothetical protein
LAIFINLSKHKAEKSNGRLFFPPICRFDLCATVRAIAIWLAGVRPNFAQLGALVTFPLGSQSAMRSPDTAVFHFTPPPFLDLGFRLVTLGQNFAPVWFWLARLNEPICRQPFFLSCDGLTIH